MHAKSVVLIRDDMTRCSDIDPTIEVICIGVRRNRFPVEPEYLRDLQERL